MWRVVYVLSGYGILSMYSILEAADKFCTKKGDDDVYISTTWMADKISSQICRYASHVMKLRCFEERKVPANETGNDQMMPELPSAPDARPTAAKSSEAIW
jgi:hypothetical protein